MSGLRLISAFGLVVVFSQISATLSGDVVPVVLFGSETTGPTQAVDALRIMSKTEFSEVIQKIVGGSRPPIAAFVKDNLCVEELSQSKLQLHTSHSNYFPSVDSPLPVLEDLEFYNISRDEKPETISNGQLIIVPVENLALVSELHKELFAKNPKVIGIIVGASCSYSRSERTRRAVTARSDTEIIAQADRVLLYSSTGIYFKPANADNYSLLGTVKSMSSVANEPDSVRFDLTFDSTSLSEVTLRLQFNATASKYWYFTNVEYESNSSVLTLTSNTSINFPFNFSYHCSNNIVFYNGMTFLNFTDLQVQIDPKIPTANGTAVFSDGWDCIGFTSIPILSGIFVTAILALIMIWAITMIMDIRTMDRFDDPKGKTITVAASE